MDESTTPEVKQTPKTIAPKVNNAFPFKLFFVLLLTMLALAGLGYGGYRGFNAFRNLDTRVSDIGNQLEAARSYTYSVEEQSRANIERVEALSNQLAAANSTSYAPYVQLYANVTIEKILEDKNSALESGFRFLLIDLKLVNNNASDVYFSAGELKLKDSDNNEFELYSSSSYDVNYVKNNTNVLFPDNRLPVSYASLIPNETIKTTVAFVLNKPSSKFTLYRNGVVLKEFSL